MSSEKIQALIIHSDRQLAKEIQTVMPGYIDVAYSKFSEAKEMLFAGVNGKKIGLVVMDADEGDADVLSIYKYIKQDPDKVGIKYIPVVLLAADEFAPNCADFFDIADPVFYTGNIDDSDFFMTINDAIDEAELVAGNSGYEGGEGSESDKKTPEKLMGKSYSIDTSVPEAMRVATYDDASLKNAITALVNGSKEKVRQIYEVLEALNAEAQAEEAEMHEEINSDATDLSGLHNINNAYKVNDLLNNEPVIRPEEMRESFYSKKTVNHYSGSKWGNAAHLHHPQNYFGTAFTNQIMPPSEKTVLIVDSDKSTLKAFSLFLGDGYKINIVDSSMKAIDYVVKNSVDIAAIEYNINGMSGISIARSIKNQPTGANVQVYMLMPGNTPYQVLFEVNNIPEIAGIIMKPIVKKQLLSAINKT